MTVTKLQSVLAFSPSEVAAIPPPLARIRELEEENHLLHRELDDLRRQLQDRQIQLRPDIGAHRPLSALDDRRVDRADIKRRRTLDHPTDTYLYSPGTHLPSPPPPLTIPSPMSPSYPSLGYPPSASMHRPTSASLMSQYGVSYTMPGTPSGSSATSSPSTQSFSASTCSLFGSFALHENEEKRS